ncbi:MAG: hypothetical protein FJZ95_07185 [Chloroflexi bacterium]|nr:hypothetical protein [Chloroflexota bacterium]
MTDAKKISAITAAVSAYLEEEAQAAAAMRREPSAGTANLWQASGRMEIMQMSALWQRRIVPKR